MVKKVKATLFLKLCLADAYVELLKKKYADQITINQITNKASVSRSTYYRHFTSKDDLLKFKLLTIIGRKRADLSANLSNVELIRYFFNLMADNHELLKILVKNNKFQILVDIILPPLANLSIKEQYQRQKYGYAFIGMLKLWIICDFKEDADKLADLYLSTWQS
ncbi:TetR/AcrR family transcriptional regulator [uncultured Limosilactobacillus sp.]|uniref:TetR/AcrR family transcriptional regulator n=1 Tax=uncultured Limosilactobacillus sp. TaxID=2837629 RepID=UPI0025EF8EB2|nr:helix-turn-helix domain-containing protein [uncultured Limosilactobacillus sp.]